jgi:hypothetical protein
MTDNLPTQFQILVIGKDADRSEILIYIPKDSTKTTMFRTNSYHEIDGICSEEYYNLDSTQIIDILDEDGDSISVYLIIGILNVDDYETHVFFGFVSEYSDNKYFINDDRDFYSFSIYNRDIQQPECLKFLGNFTWAICLQNEIRFIQIMQNLRDAFADPRTWRYEYMSIIHSGAIFYTKSIDFDLIKPFFNRGYHYSIVDTSSYSIEIYGDEIMIFMNKIKKINYSDLPDIGGTLSIEILFDEKELQSNFRCSFSEDDKKDVVRFNENIMRFNE